MGEKETMSAERASNLNLSKSNIDRLAGDPGGDAWDDPGDFDAGDAAQRATNLNTSRSNIERKSGGSGDPKKEERSANLNMSKTNIDRVPGDPGDDAAAINNTKSNIKN